MNEEYMEYLEELEESLHKGIKLLQKAKQKMGGQMGFREGGYGNRFAEGMMPNGYPPMGMPPMMGHPGQMGFREGGYGNRFAEGMMPNGYPPMGMPPMMGHPGQMGFREEQMMERRGRDSMGRYTRG